MSEEDDTRFDDEQPRLKVISLEEAAERLAERLAACRDPAERERLTINLFRVQAHLGRHGEAKALMRDLLERAAYPDDQARFLLHLGQLSEKADDFAAARTYYTEGLALESGEHWVRYFLLNNLGFTLNRFGNHVEAAGLCRRAIAINPEQHNAHKNLAVALEGLGYFPEAAEGYLRATELNPFDRRAFDHLTNLLGRDGDLHRKVPDLERRLAACAEAIEAAKLPS